MKLIMLFAVAALAAAATLDCPLDCLTAGESNNALCREVANNGTVALQFEGGVFTLVHRLPGHGLVVESLESNGNILWTGSLYAGNQIQVTAPTNPANVVIAVRGNGSPNHIDLYQACADCFTSTPEPSSLALVALGLLVRFAGNIIRKGGTLRS